jgi:Xaa-Pro aminopeptidase
MNVENLNSSAARNVAEEKVGEKFVAAHLARTQIKTWDLLFQLRNAIRPGMSEGEALEIYTRLQVASGAEKYWHPPKIRFGKNTLCAFRDPSDPEVRLQENDIFFLDLGPIYDGYEGDCGQTFQIGEATNERVVAAKKVIAKCEEIFALVKNKWLEKICTGAELYAYAEELAINAGYELVGEGAKGHRVSEFPHAVYFRGSLRQFERIPAPSRWILEIQLRDRKNNIGAFFEELI